MATTYDIAAYQSVNGFYLGTLATVFSSGRLITGVEKLSQRFLLELMTEKGSIPFDITRGSTFVSDLTNGKIFSEADVFRSFSTSLLDISSILKTEELNKDQPNDERFSNAEIIRVTLSPGVVSLRIVIRNLAGSASALTIPIELVPRNDVLASPLD